MKLGYLLFDDHSKLNSLLFSCWCHTVSEGGNFTNAAEIRKVYDESV